IILILLVVILIISHRREQKKISGFLTETKYRGSSEASFKSMNDAEGALNESDIAAPHSNGGVVNNGFSHLEEGALNTKRNSSAYQMASTSFPMDLSNGYELQDRPNHGAGVESNPDYPQNKRIYEEIDDQGTPAIIYKGNNASQNPDVSKIYDYASRESKVRRKTFLTRKKTHTKLSNNNHPPKPWKNNRAL
ncbi:hypothetical protein EGW08_009890, partial [Elysia chlorotica]